MDPDLLGSILIVPYLFVPAEYEACNGQTLNVRGHEALFDLLGTHDNLGDPLIGSLLLKSTNQRAYVAHRRPGALPQPEK